MREWLDVWGGILLIGWVFFWCIYGDIVIDRGKAYKCWYSLLAFFASIFIFPRILFPDSWMPTVKNFYTAKALLGGFDPILNNMQLANMDKAMTGGSYGWDSPFIFLMAAIWIIAIGLVIWVCTRR